MIDYLNTLDEWITVNNRVSIIRVIKTWGSSPRPIGSVMFINSDGKMIGSVSGGCVEGDVVKKVMDTESLGESKLVNYGVSDEDAWSVGLTCGGSVQVFLQHIDFTKNTIWDTLKENIINNKSSILISSLEEGKNTNTLMNEDDSIEGDAITNELIKHAKQAYSERANKTATVDHKDYFIHIFPRKSQLLIIGAAHIAVDLVSLGNQYGFETVVIDPRAYFTNNLVFENAPSRIIEKYPSEILNEYSLDAYTYCAILSHDPKIDDNALEILLPSDVAYIGALGSKKNHEKRIKRLLEKGIAQELIDKIKAPIGVSIHAKSAKEIALSIMAEIIQVKNSFI